jgi:MoaA/NifB/PqqE/SkfB family radical SAM enzyme
MPKDDPPWFSSEGLRAVLQVLRQSCWSVYLSCGGEPLLHPQFEEAMSVVNETIPNLDVAIVTNARALDARKTAILLDSCVSRIQLSVHTIEPGLYARLYGCRESDFIMVKNNIESLMNIHKKKKWPKIIITAIAMKSTLKGLPDVARWGARAGIDGMRVQWLEPYATTGMDTEEINNRSQTTAILEETQDILKKEGAFLVWPSSFRLKKLISVASETSVVRNKRDYCFTTAGKYFSSLKKNSCSLAGFTFVVNSNGSVWFCHRNAMPMPNLIDNPSSNLLRILQESVKRLDCKTNKSCQGCPYHT